MCACSSIFNASKRTSLLQALQLGTPFPSEAFGVSRRTRIKGWSGDVEEEIGFFLSHGIHFQRDSKCKTRE